MSKHRIAITTAASLLLACGALADTPQFAQAGVAFLEKHCVECHGAKKQKADLALHEFRDDLSVLKARRRWKDIVEMVRGGDMPPEKQPQPDAAEKQAFLDSVAGVFAKAGSAKPDPGRATQRRLNRTEYNNTIRDLLKVETRPADDFPSDEVGNGFDNIGDVLSVSPVLMERYLDAAERIAEAAIPVNQLKPAKRTMAGRFCEPASAHVPQDRFRPICGAETDPVRSGPLNTPARIAPDGEHVMRLRLYAKSPSGKPVKIALLVTGEHIAKPAPDSETAKLDGAQRFITNRCVILKVAEVTDRKSTRLNSSHG